jgi:hypothetical protein
MKRIPIGLAVLYSVTLSLLMVGCATGPDFATYNSSTLPPPKDGQSRIWFYRPSKVIGSGLQPVVHVNGVPIAKAQPGSFFFADRPPGIYELKCTTEWADKTPLTVVQNQVSYVRLTMLPGVFVGHVLPKVVPEEQALKEIQKCRLITADGMNRDIPPASPR